LHGDPTLDTGYSLRFDFTRERVVLELYPRPDGNSPYLSGLERPFRLQPSGTVRLSILLDGDIAVAYINDNLALTSRMPRLTNKTVSTFVEDGTMRVNNIQIFTGCQQ
jgi:Glycosyl hydrolases family 32 C terminal